MRIKVVLLGFLCFMAIASPALGADIESRILMLEQNLQKQAETISEQQKIIDELKGQRPTQTDAVGRAIVPENETAKSESPQTAKPTGLFGSANMMNPNISLVLDTFGYASSLSNGELATRGIPGFTILPKDARNGFNLGAAEDGAELFIFSPVDPYFNAYANIPISQDGEVALEEAYVVTTSLPAGLQVKGGKFKSNFSRVDAQHPHAWDFFDIPLVYRAFVGNEGLGGEKGVQLTWLPALPVYLQLGAEALQGDNDLLFGAGARSGPHAFAFFAKSSWEATENSTLYFGPSVLFGSTKNSNIVPATEFTGNSALYGLEAVWKWKPSSRQSFTLQGEYLFLDQHGDLDSGDVLERRQDGFYLQGIYQLGRWRFGARYDLLEPFTDTFKQSEVQQDFGQRPWRGTGSLEFNPSEFTRIRLQYNHDVSGRNGTNNDEVILQFIFGIGAHAAHTFLVR